MINKVMPIFGRRAVASGDNRFTLQVKSDNAGTSATNQFTIPAYLGAYNYDIETSDGYTATGLTGTHTITFPTGIGTHIVYISGDFPHIYFNNGGDKLKVLDIQNFGIYGIGSTNQQGAFSGCSNMVISATDSGNFGSVSNFSGAWQECSSIVSFPLIDTSSGTSFVRTWRSCSSLTSFPSINTTNALNMQGTWELCTSLASFPIIDVSNVTLFRNTWTNCSNLLSFPLLNTSSGTEFRLTWWNAVSLANFPANSFDSNIATNYSEAFTLTNLTTQSIDNILVSLDTCGVTNGNFRQFGGSAPSVTGESAIDSLRAKSWTIQVTGGY